MKSLFVIYDALDDTKFSASLMRSAVYRHLPDILGQVSSISHSFFNEGKKKPRPFGGAICSNTIWDTRWLECFEERRLDPPWDLSQQQFRLLALGKALPLEPAWREFLCRPEYLPCIHMLPLPKADPDLSVVEYCNDILRDHLQEVIGRMGFEIASR